ncbi:MAG: hypothetical protein U9R41_07845 [Candidatus Marinimicrobia bacterium]|nr:hypothetical protein [Candidatus Neomarinimicrobiota bacterium]
MGNNKSNILDKVKNKNAIIISIVVIIIPLFYFFAPMIFDNLRPIGVDSIAASGSSHLVSEWQKETGKTALWNPNKFGGMPIYPRKTPRLIHLDTLISYLGRIIYTYFLYFLVGGLGMFFLLKYKKIPWYLSLIIAVGFILLPQWQALLHVGHFRKIRAFMIVPWMILSFHYFFDKKSWFGMAFFALIFSWIIRTQHFQVIFYSIMILFFLFIYPFIRILIEKKFKEAGNLFLKFIVAIVLTIIIAAQPFLSIKEYTPYSTRGGNAVKIGQEQKSSEKAKGVSFDYATRWSLSPKETMTFFIPRFFGGISGEEYSGKKYPQLKGRKVPGYWGDMPFTQSYETMGMILFLFAIIGFVVYRKERFVKGLACFIIFSLLLSFGRHFAVFYKLFFYYMPYFSKFRAPMMMTSMTFISTFIMAGYGLKALIFKLKEKDMKWVLGVFGAGFGLVLLLLLFSNSYSYMKATEIGKYSGDQLAMIKNIRKEMLVRDAVKLLILLTIVGGSIWAFLSKKIKEPGLVVIIFAAVFFELFLITNHAYKMIPLHNRKRLERKVFVDSDITRFLGSQPKTSRAMVFGKDSNYYGYYYPLLSGYSAIKMQNIQDIREHCLYNAKTENRINWNVINMLNGKWIIAGGRIDESFLSPIAGDEVRKEIMYENKNALPKAWFVQNIKSFESDKSIIKYMNKKGFTPQNEALILNDENQEIQNQYSGDGEIEFIDHNPNMLKFNIKSDQKQFMVLSEIYYPIGWTAKIGKDELPIIKTNFLLRGFEVPAGENDLTVEFRPKTYLRNLKIIWVGNIIIILILLSASYPKVKKYVINFKKKK